MILHRNGMNFADFARFFIFNKMGWANGITHK